MRWYWLGDSCPPTFICVISCWPSALGGRVVDILNSVYFLRSDYWLKSLFFLDSFKRSFPAFGPGSVNDYVLSCSLVSSISSQMEMIPQFPLQFRSEGNLQSFLYSFCLFFLASGQMLRSGAERRRKESSSFRG